MACGHFDHSSCEYWDLSHNYWHSIDAYPFATDLIQYAVVYHNLAFYYFGGYQDSKTIAKLDSQTYEWTKVGELNQGRYSHAVIQLDNSFLCIGGYGLQKTERCELKNSTVTCESQAPELQDYRQNPELFLVSDDFCQEI